MLSVGHVESAQAALKLYEVRGTRGGVDGSILDARLFASSGVGEGKARVAGCTAGLRKQGLHNLMRWHAVGNA
eukprot:5761117-Pleurochrysis_carterae.AAC.1